MNARLTAPTEHADAYMGLSLGQLLVALGLALKGMPAQRLDDIRLVPSPRVAVAPHALAAPSR